MYSLLFVEDAEDQAELIQYVLQGENVQVHRSGTIADALNELSRSSYDLVLLDKQMPDGDGVELYQTMQKTPKLRDVPVLFLTACNDLSVKVFAFSMGAEDYMVKPVNLVELKARILSKLRRSEREKKKGDMMSIGPFIFDVQRQRLKLQDSNTAIDLSPREFRMMMILAKNEGKILSREQILTYVLGSRVHVTDRTVDTYICFLRKKLGQHGVYLESVAGVGYRLNLERVAAEPLRKAKSPAYSGLVHERV